MGKLKRSGDRKTAMMVRRVSRDTPKVNNAFGLPAGKEFSCPGATSVCESICYAGKIEKVFPSARSLLMHNWELLRNASREEMVELLREMVAEFVAECDKYGTEKLFRIHWDGDFHSREYAQAWATVVREFPNVQFWVYTRSFVPSMNVLPDITGIGNLVVYLSSDAANRDYVASALLEYPEVRVATLAETAKEAKEIAPRAANSCPENVESKLPLVSETSEGWGIGACAVCQLCPQGRKDVAFATSGKEAVPA